MNILGIRTLCCFIGDAAAQEGKQRKDGSLVHLYHRFQHHVNITGMKKRDPYMWRSWIKILRIKIGRPFSIFKYPHSSFRCLVREFLSWTCTNLQTTGVCWRTGTRASPAAGLIFGFAWRTIRPWCRRGTASLGAGWRRCWGRTRSAPRTTLALYRDPFGSRSSSDGR